MELMRKCLDTLQSQCNEEPHQQNVKYKEIIENHENFSRFIDPISFEEFLQKYTNSDCVTGLLKNESKGVDYLAELSDAATQPNVVELIARNLLQNLKSKTFKSHN